MTTRNEAQMERDNANYIGGDINGGVQNLGQLFTRPVARLDPYATPNKRLYICSSSTPQAEASTACMATMRRALLCAPSCVRSSPDPTEFCISLQGLALRARYREVARRRR